MPLVTLAALVSPRQVSLDSIDGSSAVPSSEAHSLSANKKGNGSGGKFFVKAAADGAGTSNNGEDLSYVLSLLQDYSSRCKSFKAN